MNNKLIEKMQQALIKISLDSVGRSIPIGVFEKEVPESVLKLCEKSTEDKILKVL